MSAEESSAGKASDAAARADAILAELAELGSDEARAGMARYGIATPTRSACPSMC